MHVGDNYKSSGQVRVKVGEVEKADEFWSFSYFANCGKKEGFVIKV